MISVNDPQVQLRALIKCGVLCWTRAHLERLFSTKKAPTHQRTQESEALFYFHSLNQEWFPPFILEVLGNVSLFSFSCCFFLSHTIKDKCWVIFQPKWRVQPIGPLFWQIPSKFLCNLAAGLDKVSLQHKDGEAKNETKQDYVCIIFILKAWLMTGIH